MKVLVTGSRGQLGWELQHSAPESIELLALDSAALDITDAGQVARIVKREAPNWVINTAAYTAVDKAEQESDLAYLINSQGAAHIATACKMVGAKMLHISTDFVFDGQQGKPYQIDSFPNPLCVYGSSKLAGEEAVKNILHDSVTVRTSWVYSSHGNNFVKTMLRLMNEKPSLNIVSDQVGSPTWAHGLSRALWEMLEMDCGGLFHWSDSGVASWYDFAVAIYEEASHLGLISNQCTISPIRSDEYPQPARRPNYSVLDKSSTTQATGLVAEHWRVALRQMLIEFKNQI